MRVFYSVIHRKEFVTSESVCRRVERSNFDEIEGTRCIPNYELVNSKLRNIKKIKEKEII